ELLRARPHHLHSDVVLLHGVAAERLTEDPGNERCAPGQADQAGTAPILVDIGAAVGAVGHLDHRLSVLFVNELEKSLPCRGQATYRRDTDEATLRITRCVKQSPPCSFSDDAIGNQRPSLLVKVLKLEYLDGLTGGGVEQALET